MATAGKTRNKNLTVPNAISVVRIIIVPFFAYFYLRGNLMLSVGLLVLSGLSDLVDGWIARRFNQVTELGKLLDPLADKITQGVVAICLSIKTPFIRPILMLFIIKEGLMVVCGLVLLRKKKRPCPAQWYGKVATTMFYITVTVIVFIRSIFEGITPAAFEVLSYVLLALTAVMMLYAAVRYFMIFLTIMRSDDEQYRFDLKTEMKMKKPEKTKIR